MSNQNETGHAKNVANFEFLLTLVNGLDQRYNPAIESIQVAKLQETAANGNSILTEFNICTTAYSKAVAERETAFASLSKCATRVFNALKATGTPTTINDGARALVRKIQGIRASAKLTNEEKEALIAQGKTVIEKSSSQMSYDNRLNSFDKLVKYVGNIPEYNPFEEDLSVAGLTSYYNELDLKNKEVINTLALLYKARVSRDYFLYSEKVGLVSVAASVKAYVLSVFGYRSIEYKQLAAIKFRTISSVSVVPPVNIQQPNT